MYLFEDEVVNITKIYTVELFKSPAICRHSTIKTHTYELFFHLSGVLDTYYGSTHVEDVPNSIRYLPKMPDSDEYIVDVKEPGECIAIFFDTDDALPEFALGIKNLAELKPLFLKIYTLWNAKKTGYYAECMSILYEIIRHIKLHGEKYLTSKQEAKILPSYNYMLENFASRDFNYRKMCAKSGLSYDYFKELFIARYGTTPVKYVTMLKINKAKELLITGMHSVTQIAEMCGFDNVYYFSTVFKKQTGVSPKNYKM